MKNPSDECYSELKNYFDERKIRQVLVLKEDEDIGVFIRRNIGIPVMVKFNRGSRI